MVVVVAAESKGYDFLGPADLWVFCDDDIPVLLRLRVVGVVAVDRA